MHEDPGDRPLLGKNAAYGLLAWTTFSLLAVFLRGIRWDEHFELAEVILGRMPYPDSHPLFIWTRYVRNLPIFLSSAIVWAFPSPEVICAIRNTLWLLATVVPVFLLGTLLTKRIWCGHIAAILILMGIHQSFDANYPLYAWPGFFSNGHIGRGFALTVLCLLLARNWRSAFIMLGLLPAIHPGQAPIIYAFAALLILYLRKSSDFKNIARALPLAAPGLILWAGLWLDSGLSLPPAAAGAYYSPVDAHAIAQAYTEQHPHWAAPGTIVSYANSNFILAATLLLALAGAHIEYTRNRKLGPWCMLSAYFIGVALVVWLTMALHSTLGSRLPYALIAWMPYRFTNHAATLIPAMIPALFFFNDSARAGRAALCILAAGLLFEALRPALAGLTGATLYHRYLSTSDAVTFAWIGTAAAQIYSVVNKNRPLVIAWTTAALAAFSFFALFHQFGAVSILLGFATALVLTTFTPRIFPAIVQSAEPRALRSLVYAAALLVLSLQLLTEWKNRQTLPRSEFDTAVTQYLQDRGEALAMVASHPDQHRLQSRIGHPILADGATASAIVYTPRLAPTIQKIHDDLWKLRFFPPRKPGADPWSVTWEKRSPEKWAKLGRMYSFKYVISTQSAPLSLDPVLTGAGETLYRIPNSVLSHDGNPRP